MEKIDIRLPDGRLIRNVPKGMPKDEILRRADSLQKHSLQKTSTTSEAPKEPEEEVEPSLGGQFVAGFKDIGNTVTNSLPAYIAQELGAEKFAQKQYKDYNERASEIQKQHPQQFESYKDIDGVGSALNYLGERTARGLPSLLPSAVLAVGGGLAAGTVVSGLALKGIVKKAVAAGATAGGTVGAASQTIPSEFIDKLDQGVEPSVAANTALVSGALQASLEAITPLGIAKKFLPKNTDDILVGAVNEAYLKKIGKESANTAWKEGLTEGTQEVISQSASKIVNEDAEFNLEDIVENILSGASVGGVVGGAVGAVEKVKPKGVVDYSEVKETKEELADKFSEEVPESENIPTPEENQPSVTTPEPVLETPEAVPTPEPVKQPEEVPTLVETPEAVKEPEKGVPTPETNVAGEKYTGEPEKDYDKWKKNLEEEKEPQEKSAVKKEEPQGYKDFKKEFWHVGEYDKKSNIAFEARVPKEVRGLITEFKDLFNIDAPMLVTSFESVTPELRQNLKLRLPSATTKGTLSTHLGKGFMLQYRGDRKINASTIETILHEMGHAHQQRVFNNAPLSIRKEVDTAYKAWKKSTEDGSVNDALRKKGTYTNVEKNIAEIGEWGETAPIKNHPQRNYILSFEEWYADQVSRWATSQKKPQTIVDKYFKDIADFFKKVFKKAQNKGYLPDETFKEYMKKVTAKGFDTGEFSKTTGLRTQPSERIISHTNENISKDVFTGYPIKPQSIDTVYNATRKALQEVPNVLTTVLNGLPNMDAKGKNSIQKVQTLKTQVGNLGHTLQNYKKDVIPRSIGESIRLLLQSNVVSDADRTAVLGKNEVTGDKRVNEIIRFINDGATFGVGEIRDIARQGKTPIIAEGFKTYVNNKRQGISNDALPAEIRQTFEKMDNYLEQESAKLPEDFDITQGISPQIVRQTEPDGTVVFLEEPKVDIEEFISQSNVARNITTQGRIKEALPSFKRPKIEEDSTLLRNHLWVGNAMRFAGNVAAKSPLFAEVFNAAIYRASTHRRVTEQAARLIEKYYQAPAPKRQFVGDLMADLRLLKQRAQIEGDIVTYKIDGKTRRITDPEAVAAFKALRNTFEYFKDLDQKVNRARMMPIFARAGLGFDPTPRDFEVLKAQIENKIIPKKHHPSARQMQALEDYFAYLKDFTEGRNYEYIPFSRYGNQGLSVTLNNSENGKAEFFTSYAINPNGKVDEKSKERAYQEMQEWIESQGLSESDYKIGDFQLTHNNVRRLLPKSAQTIELINQMITDSNHKAFATFSKDARDENGNKIDLDVDEDSDAELAAKFLQKQPFKMHFQPAKELAGYSKDWDRAISSYISGGSYYTADSLYAPKIQTANARVQTKATADNLKEYSQKYVESIQDPQDALQVLRTMQYLGAFAGNVSSGALQLQSMVSTMPMALSMANGGSLIEAGKSIGKATKLVTHFTNKDMKLGENILDFGNLDKHKKLIDKGIITPTQSRFILELHDNGTLNPAQTLEFTEGSLEVAESGANWRTKLEKTARLSGIFMSSTEEATRAIQTLAALDTLSKGNRAEMMHQKLMQSDQSYAARIKNSPTKGPDNVKMAQWMVEKALGQYGKEGRAPFQNTILAVTLMPFSTYPLQMLANTATFLSNYGPEGKRAALNGMALILIGGGIWALPGAEELKKMVEVLWSELEEEDISIDEILNNLMGPSAGYFANHGILDKVTGTGISERTRLGTPFAPVVDLIRGDLDAIDFAGVQGSFLEAPVKMIKAMKEGMAAHDAFFSSLPLPGIANAYKGLFLYPDEGKKYRGQNSISLNEEVENYGGDAGNMLKRALGFQPLAEKEAKLEIDRLSYYNDRYKKHTPKYTKRLERNYVKLMMSDSPKDREKAAEKLYATRKDLINFYVSKNIPNIKKRVDSAMREAATSARTTVSNKLNLKKYSPHVRHKAFE